MGAERLTDETGNVTAVIELDPWGGETDRCVNQWQQPYLYTTYERDGDGVDQAVMRSYHGWWARFNEPDPWDGSYDLSDPQSFNRYAYVQNDPVNFVDPSGLDRFCIIDVSYRHFEYINKDGDQTIRIETILHQTCFDVPTAPIGGGYNGDIGSGGVLALAPQRSQRLPFQQERNQVLQKLREQVKKECLERKKREADRARAEYLARYPDRVFRGMKLGAARGLITGGYIGATGGFAALGWGTVPGTVAGAFVGATVGAAGGAITSGFFFEPLQRVWYDHWIYRPALDRAEIECDIEADSAFYRAGGL